jgi:hypothetical protein
MIKRALVLVMSCGAFALGCAQEQDVGTPEEVAGVDETQETIDNLTKAGFPASDIMVVDGVVYVGRDAEVSLAASREMLQAPAGPEQYRTTNLVSSNVNDICIIPQGYSGKFSQALDLAIENYNQRNLSFSMRRTTSTSGCDAVIRARLVSGNGGSAGFPSGGSPFGQINIGSALSSFSVDTIEHVITHELGHCIGFRHSDFFNRSISCGSGGNEGSAGVGAIHISGTPTGATVGGSIMNSCFRSNESGEWTSSDRTALQTIY